MVWHVKLVSFPKQSSAWTSPPFYVPFVSKKRPVLLKSTSRQSWSRHVHCQMDMYLMISYVNCHQVRSGSEAFHVFILQYVGVHNLTFCEMGCQRQTAYCITRYFLLRKYHKTCPRLWKSSVLARRISCKCFLHVRKSLSPIQSQFWDNWWSFRRLSECVSGEMIEDHTYRQKKYRMPDCTPQKNVVGIYDYQYPTKIQHTSSTSSHLSHPTLPSPWKGPPPLWRVQVSSLIPTSRERLDAPNSNGAATSSGSTTFATESTESTPLMGRCSFLLRL